MSTRLGTLTLDLVARIGSFTGPIRDAERQTESSFANMRNHVNTYGMAVAGAAAGAVTALAAMAMETSNQAVELERFAFRANTTTQEFQKMAVGAQAFGIEAETLSAMMKDFNEKLGELTAVGAGGGVDFFEQIAVKTEGSAEAAEKLILKMQKLSGPEALQLYIDKLEEAGVPQQQMSFYLESMASDVTDLIPLLVNGGEGMRLYGDMAERAGIIMTDKTIESAKMLQDQVYMLDLQMQGAKNQLMQAVIPAFVDIAEAFFSGSEQGVQFSGAAEGVANTLRYVAKVAIGAATAVQLVGKVIGGLIATGAAILSGNIGDTQAIQDVMVEDMQETIEAAAAKFDIIDNRAASSKAEQLRGVRELQQANTKTSSGLSELAAKQNEVAKSAKVNTKATSDNAKAQQELNRVLEEQKRILYEYSTGDNQQKMDLESEIQRLTKNGMSDFIPTAKARFDAEQRLIKMKFEFELAEHLMTEEQKLKFSNTIKQQEIMADAKLSKDQRAEKLKSLDEQYAIELQTLENSQAKELLQTKQHYMSAADYAEEYYALVRAEILATANYSPEKKSASIKQANALQGVDQAQQREGVWADYTDRFAPEQLPYDQDAALLKAARDEMLITEEEYQKQRLALQMTYGAQYGADFAGMMMGLVDSSSSAHAVLGGIQKGAALFSTAMNSYTAISAAWASAPFPYNLPAVGMATMETGLLQAAVSAMSPVGMAHNGIDNIPKEGTWLLDGGERVLNPNQNKDLTKYLANQQQQGSSIVINNNAQAKVIANQGSDGKTYITVDELPSLIAGQLRNPNSRVSKSIQQNTTASRRR